MPSFKFPSTVDALAIAQTGDINVLEKMTLPFPKVKPGDLVVKVYDFFPICVGLVDPFRVQIEYIGVNFIDTYFREGLYPLDHFPTTIGEEAAGIIVALPTDPEVLGNPSYKRQGFEVGMSVAVVCHMFLYLYMDQSLCRPFRLLTDHNGYRPDIRFHSLVLRIPHPWCLN